MLAAVVYGAMIALVCFAFGYYVGRKQSKLLINNITSGQQICHNQIITKKSRGGTKRMVNLLKKAIPGLEKQELTDEEIEALRKSLKEDEMRYEAKVKDWQRISHFQSY